jgi:hypothetical protein
VSNSSPPSPDPIVTPILKAIEFNDITVPLSSGTCSNVKLSEAVYLIEETTQPTKSRAAETKGMETLRYANINTPSINELKTATRCLPSLLTRWPPAKLPTVKLVEVPTRISHEKLRESWVICLI